MERVLLHEDVDVMVKVIPRIEALYYFVYELAECFHADNETLSSIKTGILENQIIRSIILYYKNSLGENVGIIEIKIDWDKHFLLVSTEESKELEIDLSKSVVENMVGWKKIAVTHIEKVMEQYEVTSVEGRYLYRKPLYTDEMLPKVREIMNTEPAKSIDSVIDPEFQKDIDRILDDLTTAGDSHTTMKKRTLSGGVMEEVTVDMYYKV